MTLSRAGKPSTGTLSIQVESYNRPGPYTLLAISAVTYPDYLELLYRLLRGHMDFWIKQYPERYIRKIYAQSVSDRGEMLIQHLFMAPRADLAFNAYELDFARTSASKIIRNFRVYLDAKAPLPNDLRWPSYNS